VGSNPGLRAAATPSTSQGVRPGRVRSGRDSGELSSESPCACALSEAARSGARRRRGRDPKGFATRRVRAGATAARAGADVDAGVETRDALETRVTHPAGDDMMPHSRALAGVTRSAPRSGTSSCHWTKNASRNRHASFRKIDNATVASYLREDLNSVRRARARCRR
jgi:hypothetical protein